MASDSAQVNPEPVWVWGLPLAPLTFQQTLEAVDRLIRERTPRYFITANLHYAMLTARDKRLGPVNQAAVFILADGMPLVWASRWRPRRLPERVTGSDLIPALCARAAERGYRVFFLGGAPDVVQEARRRLLERHPTLQIVGVESPPFRPLSPPEHAALVGRIRDARPDLLFIAFGQPKGELWMAEHCPELGVPASVQIGATVDFLADRVPRAPRWLQKIGFEWAYRFYREPKRLGTRYLSNIVFALKMLVGDLFTRRSKRR
jgi:N-acetylglucosaminyldiphosphoundecaprenol N-acetyl-beta-D-mannosaminyltransferase